MLQEISESATRALELAEQRLAEAAAELQRRSAVLEEVSAEKDAALAKVKRPLLFLYQPSPVAAHGRGRISS